MIGSINSSSALSQMAGTLFSKLDSKNQGYVEQSDLESAFSTLGSSRASAEDVFSALDGDGDGKVTQSEFSDSLKSLLSELQGQLQSSQTAGMAGMPPPPPPPPPEGDQGFTQEELTAMAEEVSGTDSDLSELMATIAEDFATADTDGDGRVNHDEAMAYQSAYMDSATGSASGSASSTDTAASQATESDVLRQILDLLRAYGQSDQAATSSLFTQA